MTTTTKGKTKRRHLSPVERETIINFNEGDREAHIFTYNKAWQKHLETRLGLKPDYDNGYGGREYTIDKSRVFPPKAKRQYSVEVKRKMADRLAKARSKQGILI